MKKTMLVLLSVLLVVTSVLTLTACKQGCDQLGHDVSEWSVKTAATCTVAGEKVGTCSRCGEEVSDTIPALGHDWGEEVVVPATCGVAGTGTKSCSRCDAKDVRDIPATENHSWVADAESDKNRAATCTEKGVQAEKCSVCNKTREVETAIDETAHQLGEVIPAVEPTCADGTIAHKICSLCKKYFSEEGELLGADESVIVDPAVDEHSYQDDDDESRASEKVEPTCAPGVQPTKCSVCGDLSTRAIPATGAHDFEGVQLTDLVPATCTTEGTKAHKACNNCGLFCDDEGQLIGEGKAEDLVIEKIPHNWEDDNEADGKVEPTCGAAGVQPTKCSYGCGATSTRELEATGVHQYDKYEAVESWTHNVLCSVCGAIQGDAAVACTGDWNYTDEGHNRSCQYCTNEESTGHTAKTSGGTYVKGEEKHTVACSVTACGRTLTQDCNNKTTGTCSVCRHVYKPANEWIVVGATGGTSWKDYTTDKAFIFTYNHEDANYTLRYNFKSLDVFQIKKNISGNWSGQLGGNALGNRVTYAPGISPVEGLFDGSGNITVKFDCTVVITLNSSATQMSIYVEDVTVIELIDYFYNFYLYAPSWSGVKIHMWDGPFDTGSWGSTSMTSVGNGWWKYVAKSTGEEATGKYNKVIIYNGSNDNQRLSFEGSAFPSGLTIKGENMFFSALKGAIVYETIEATEAPTRPTDWPTDSVDTVAAILPVRVKFDLAA